jgi:hypothetical protein
MLVAGLKRIARTYCIDESCSTIAHSSGRAVPGSRGTSPGEPAGAVGALRKAPPRSGPPDANPRHGKRVKLFISNAYEFTLKAL